MSTLDLLATALAIPPCLLLIVYVMEVLAGLRPLKTLHVEAGAMPSTVVLIPAHNEANGIAATVAAAQCEEDAMIKVLVVADNCNDETAVIARTAGAEVVERNDPLSRGKGFALAYGRDQLVNEPPACVVVLDADCVIEGVGIAGLAHIAVATGRAVQARNLQRPDPVASPTAQISGFAFLVKNLLRQRGMMRLGGAAALTGTGMAFPWNTFAAAPLASADLAEDLSLGMWLAQRGEAPLFLESAHVWSDPASAGALMAQRSRWERGFLSTARKRALTLFYHAIILKSRSCWWAGAHLLVPPLALLFTIAGTLLVIVTVLGVCGASFIPAFVLLMALASATFVTTFAWARAGRAYVSGAALLRVPKYIIEKLPLYGAMFADSDGWVRTRRADDP